MWKFAESNFNTFREALQEINWENIFNGETIDTIAENQTQIFLRTAKEKIINKKDTVRPDDKGWYDGYLRGLNREKKRNFENLKNIPQSYI